MGSQQRWLVTAVLGTALTVGSWAGDERQPAAPASQTPAADLKAQSELRERLAKIVIPKCSFKDAELQTIVAFIKQRTTELDPAGRSFNVFYQCDKAAKTQKLSLELEQVPVPALLRLVCLAALTPVNFKIDEHTVVITPRTEKERISEY